MSYRPLDERRATMTNRPMPVMSFGKHTGKPLNAIPKGYLRWLIANVSISQELKADITAILDGQPLPLPVEEQLEAMFGGQD